MRSRYFLSIIFLELGVSMLSSCASSPDAADTAISYQKALQYPDVMAFVRNHLQTRFTNRELLYFRIDTRTAARQGIFYYEAETYRGGGEENVRALKWPRDELETFCIARGGTFAETQGHVRSRITTFWQRLNAPLSDKDLEQANVRGAFGRKTCYLGEVALWNVYIGVGSTAYDNSVYSGQLLNLIVHNNK